MDQKHLSISRWHDTAIMRICTMEFAISRVVGETSLSRLNMAVLGIFGVGTTLVLFNGKFCIALLLL